MSLYLRNLPRISLEWPTGTSGLTCSHLSSLFSSQTLFSLYPVGKETHSYLWRSVLFILLPPHFLTSVNSLAFASFSLWSVWVPKTSNRLLNSSSGNDFIHHLCDSFLIQWLMAVPKSIIFITTLLCWKVYNFITLPIVCNLNTWDRHPACDPCLPATIYPFTFMHHGNLLQWNVYLPAQPWAQAGGSLHLHLPDPQNPSDHAFCSKATPTSPSFWLLFVHEELPLSIAFYANQFL